MHDSYRRSWPKLSATVFADVAESENVTFSTRSSCGRRLALHEAFVWCTNRLHVIFTNQHKWQSCSRCGHCNTRSCHFVALPSDWVQWKENADDAWWARSSLTATCRHWHALRCWAAGIWMFSSSRWGLTTNAVAVGHARRLFLHVAVNRWLPCYVRSS